ncbi:uncharacterized protein LOC106012138 [Aplysia californica]|uniref:Uncharacterized protein LOC106012138 n=1 Tax=Aplysia californica TaxID=6500 RepID=A0ABM1A2J7_APLCA|nr:uncharacterized protein LOC106012138 [Aplysia californica]
MVKEKTEPKPKMARVVGFKDTMGRLGTVVVMLITTINMTILTVRYYSENHYWEAVVHTGLLVLLHIPVIFILSLGVISAAVQKTRKFVVARRKKKKVGDVEKGESASVEEEETLEIVLVEEVAEDTLKGGEVNKDDQLILSDELLEAPLDTSCAEASSLTECRSEENTDKGNTHSEESTDWCGPAEEKTVENLCLVKKEGQKETKSIKESDLVLVTELVEESKSTLGNLGKRSVKQIALGDKGESDLDKSDSFRLDNLTKQL